MRKQFPGAKYHITVRGNGRRTIFVWDEDRRRFRSQLDESLDQYGVVLYAYVLMSNHYHLLIETPRGNVSRFMQRLNTAYGMYFRNKHRRPGHVLQGRYGAKLVEGDEYLLGVTRYIHLNPVKVKEVKKLSKQERLKVLRGYPWSSYRGYVDKKAREERVDYRWRGLVGGTAGPQRVRYRGFVESMVLESDQVLLDAMKRSRYALGEEEFVGRVERELRGQRRRATQSDIHWPAEEGISLGSIKAAVAGVYGCRAEDLERHGHVSGEAKRVAVGLACRLTNLTRREIGQEFGGLTGSAVSHHSRMLKQETAADPSMRGRTEKILKRLGAEREDI
ncbi:MAG: transposase [Kiritimatiellae bacterium]|nr:transposase [Kiritimatiellia bacterium]